MHHLTTDSGISIAWVGPPLEQGPLPAFFYFALTAEESLSLPPFDTPIKELSSIRCFSLTIPFHGPSYDPRKMVELLGNALERGNDPITPFIDQCVEAVDFILPYATRIGAGGVSRGGFVALHLAARHPKVNTVLAFAPVIQLAYLSGYDVNNPLVQKLSPASFAHKLTSKKIRIYIGDQDASVGTTEVMQFAEKLGGSTELFVTPSIGHKGHGTPQQSFIDGAHWILLEL